MNSDGIPWTFTGNWTNIRSWIFEVYFHGWRHMQSILNVFFIGVSSSNPSVEWIPWIMSISNGLFQAIISTALILDCKKHTWYAHLPDIFHVIRSQRCYPSWCCAAAFNEWVRHDTTWCDVPSSSALNSTCYRLGRLGPENTTSLESKYTLQYWLVVWNMNFMTFHILGMS